MSYMGLKLGPAIKLLGCIEDLKPKKSRWNIYLDAYISFCGASLIHSFQKKTLWERFFSLVYERLSSYVAQWYSLNLLSYATRLKEKHGVRSTCT